MSGGDPAARTPGGCVEVALAVALRAGRLLVARRGTGGHLAGCWEFPGGRIEPGESPEAAARRELAEETALDARSLQPLAVVVHEYPGRAVRLHVFLAPEPAGEVRTDGGRAWAWKTIGEVSALEMPAANGPILGALRWRLAAGSGDAAGRGGR